MQNMNTTMPMGARRQNLDPIRRQINEIWKRAISNINRSVVSGEAYPKMSRVLTKRNTITQRHA